MRKSTNRRHFSLFFTFILFYALGLFQPHPTLGNYKVTHKFHAIVLLLRWHGRHRHVQMTHKGNSFTQLAEIVGRN